MDEDKQRAAMKEMTEILANEKVAKDINGYPKAPPSFRVWGGGTVEPDDIKLLLPWIEWAYQQVKSKYT